MTGTRKAPARQAASIADEQTALALNRARRKPAIPVTAGSEPQAPQGEGKNGKRTLSEMEQDDYEISPGDPAEEIENAPKRPKTTKASSKKAPEANISRVTTRSASGRLPASSVRGSIEAVQINNKDSLPVKPRKGRPPKKSAPQGVEALRPADGNEDQSNAGRSTSKKDPQAKGRGRGRLRKDSAPQAVEASPPADGNEDQSNAGRPTPKKDSRSKKQQAHREVDGQEGSSAIPTNASPERARSQRPNEAQMLMVQQVSEATEDVSEAGDALDTMEDRLYGLESSDTIFDIDTLVKMCKTSKHVGYSYNKRAQHFVEVETDREPRTDIGESLLIELQDLVETYKSLVEEGDTGLSEDSPDLKRILSGIKDGTNLVLTQFSGSEERDQASSDLCRDLYFCVIPKLTRATHAAAVLYGLERDTDQIAIRKLLRLSKMLHILAEAALQESSKERAPGTKALNVGYLYTRPTKQNRPLIEALCASLAGELHRRQKVKRDREQKKLDEQREILRKIQEEKMRVALKLEIEERKRGQREALRRQLQDPVTRHMCRVEFEKIARRADQGRNPSGSQIQSQRAVDYRRSEASHRYEEEEDEPYYPYANDEPAEAEQEEQEEDEDEEYEEDAPELQRVQVFDNNNNRHDGGPVPWSKEQKQYFIEFLKNDHGQGRYQRLAKEMERSMDEIFAMAKDLQEVMDQAHEHGQMDGPGNEWTHSIWGPGNRA